MTYRNGAYVSRRSVVASGAWSIPAIVTATTAPAFAASSAVAPAPISAKVHLCGGATTGSQRTYEVTLTLASRADTFTVTTVVAAKRTYRPVETKKVTGTQWRMTLTTAQPLSTNGALTVSYLSNGSFQTTTLAYTSVEGHCAA